MTAFCVFCFFFASGYLSGGEDYYTHGAAGSPGCTKLKDLWFGTPGNGRPPRNGTGYYSGIYSNELYAEFIVRHILGHDPTTPLFVYAAFQGVHYPLEVPRRFFDRYASSSCVWEDQQLSPTSGYPNGFDCSADPAFPGLNKPGLDCECNRLLVRAQVSALSEAVGNITDALQQRGMWNNT